VCPDYHSTDLEYLEYLALLEDLALVYLGPPEYPGVLVFLEYLEILEYLVYLVYLDYHSTDLEYLVVLAILVYLDYPDCHQDLESEHLVFLEDLVFPDDLVFLDYLDLVYLENLD
jgi:hypothetical protein